MFEELEDVNEESVDEENESLSEDEVNVELVSEHESLV